MRSFLSFITVLFLALLLMSNGCEEKSVSSTSKEIPVKAEKTAIHRTSDSPDYEKDWQKVDSLSKKGLTKSALEIIDAIFLRAEKEGNQPMQFKALMQQMNFNQYIEEETFLKSLQRIEKIIQSNQEPLKQIATSVKAEMLWQYFSSNRYQIYNRTHAEDFELSDPTKWDLKTFVYEVGQLYNASLQNPNLLQKTAIQDYSYILMERTENELLSTPTVYDLLANRALKFYQNDESGITRPAERFAIDSPNYFSSDKLFLEISTETEDTLSSLRNWVMTMQELVRFHGSNTHPVARLRYTIERLQTAYNKTSAPEKNEWYEQVLLRLKKDFVGNPSFGEINWKLAELYTDLGNNATPSDAHYGLLKKALELSQETIANYPNTYGASQCKDLAKELKRRELSGKTESFQTANQAILAQVNFRNLDSVYVHVYQVTNLENKKYYSRFKDELKDMKFLSVQGIALPKIDDLQKHTTEVKIDALGIGTYLIAYSTSREIDDDKTEIYWSSGAITVTNLMYSTRYLGNGKTGIQVVNRSTGNAVKHAKVEVYKQEYNYSTRKNVKKLLNKYTSDANGWVEAATNQRKTTIIEVSNGKDLISSSRYTYYNDKDREKSYYSDHLFTDRAIYRPGQKVYFKGIRLKYTDKKRTVETSSPVEVKLYNTNRQEVGVLKLKSNEYGSYAGEFMLPETGMTGQMHIKTEHGNVYFSVEEYKRPTFKVNFEKSKKEYQLGETIEVEGSVMAYAGNTVGDATVKYVVKREFYLPYWRMYSYRYWPIIGETTIVQQGTTSTDEKGVFKFEFNATKDKSKNYLGLNYNYTIEVDVTDGNGETRSGSKFLSVSEYSLNLSLTADDFDKRKKNAIVVKGTNSEGIEIPIQGEVKIYQLENIKSWKRARNWDEPDYPILSKKEFAQYFPHIEGKEAHFMNRQKIGTPRTFSFNTAVTNSVPLTMATWEIGDYLIEVTTKDKNGKEVKELKFVQLSDSKGSEAQPNEILYAKTDKAAYEPGETVQLTLSSNMKNQLVLMETNWDGEIIEKQHLELNDNQKTITFKVEEKHRGGVSFHFTTYKYGTEISLNVPVKVPYSNKELQVSFETFRDKLLPGENEEWRLRISGPKKEKVAAEMLIAMYDASLDAFKSHSYNFNPFTMNSSPSSRMKVGEGLSYGRNYGAYYYNYYRSRGYVKPDLNWFGYYVGYGGGIYDSSPIMYKSAGRASETIYAEASPPPTVAGVVEMEEMSVEVKAIISEDEIDKQIDKEVEAIPLRTNFNETAFFLPQLKTDSNGDILVSFTVPESLTSWKVMGLTHTKEVQFALFNKEVITQKEVMVQTNLPRFLRTGDEVVLTSKVSNLTETALNGTAKLQLLDALTMKEVGKAFKINSENVTFSVEAKQSTIVSWNVQVPVDYVGSLVVRVSATADKHSDGEELTVPVLTDKVLVTESMPMTTNGKGTKEFTFDKLVNNNSSTLQHHAVTLEYSSNPAWYVIQALPYMLEYPYECSEQIFTRFYANSIASNIVRSTPKIKEVFDKWQASSPEAFLSNLEKNQELKNILLEETPWVLNAQNETERKKRIALLFDFNKMDKELALNLQKLQKAQVSNGGFPWFPGMRENRYITQYIVSGIGHLNELGITVVKEDKNVQRMITNAVKYLDNRIIEDYEYWKRRQKENPTIVFEPTNLQYLYARSFFLNIKLSKQAQEAFDFFRTNTEKRAFDYNLNNQAMLALTSYRLGNKTLAQDIMRSILERSITSEEMGMYWKENERGYYWYQAPIETQALLIEALTLISKDTKAVNNAKIWLLRNKQTNDWKTTTATANAAYALLLGGNSFTNQSENVKIEINGKEIKPEDFGTQAEAGTGYFKATWTGKEISKELGNVSVTRKTDGFSWGAMYWQYFESMEKVTGAETSLKLKKQLFIVQQTNAGEVMHPIKDGDKVKRGDKIRVRIELASDRNIEFVHMKDYRSAGFEPINVLTQYKRQGGLGYYESTRDAATHFFFDYLPKGSYVFEYDLRVFHSGNFSNGFAQIECMYAPEFKSHSNGVRVVVE